MVDYPSGITPVVKGDGTPDRELELYFQEISDRFASINAALAAIDLTLASHAARLDALEAEQIVQNNDIAANAQAIADNTAFINQTRTDVRDNFTASGYGQMRTSATAAPFPNIGAAWQTIDVFDTVEPNPTRGVTFNAATDTFTYDASGMWLLQFTLVFEHNASNSGRTTRVRAYNVTQDSSGNGLVVSTGRNAEATATTGTLLMPVENAGDTWRLEIGGSPDTYSSVLFDSAAVVLTQVGTGADVLSDPA